MKNILSIFDHFEKGTESIIFTDQSNLDNFKSQTNNLNTAFKWGANYGQFKDQEERENLGATSIMYDGKTIHFAPKEKMFLFYTLNSTEK